MYLPGDLLYLFIAVVKCLPVTLLYIVLAQLPPPPFFKLTLDVLYKQLPNKATSILIIASGSVCQKIWAKTD